MVATPTVDEVEAGYKGQPVENGELSNADASALTDEAVSMFDAVFADQILFQSESRDAANAVKLLARHKWALRLGQTVSEAQSGGSASYNIPASTERSLQNTTYGLEFLEYLGDVPNISVFRTR